MTEAFEIGVSLALQDGVSEAIGKARRDVAALEHAVRESGISLRSLRDVGARSASVAFEDRRREAGDAPPRRVEPEMAPRLALEEPRLEASTLHSDAVASVEKGVAPRAESAASRPVESAVAPQMEAVGESPALQDVGAWPGLGAIWAEAATSREAAPVPSAKSVEDVVLPMPRLEVSPGEPVAPALIERPKEPQTITGTLTSAPTVAAPLERSEDSRRVAAPVEVVALADDGESDEVAGRHEMAPAAAPQIMREEVSQAQQRVAQIPGRADALAMWGAEGTQDAPLPEERPASKAGTESGLAGPMSLLSALRFSGGSPAGTQGADHSTAVGEDVAAPYDETVADISAPATAAPATMPLRRSAAGVGAPHAKENDTEQVGARDAGPQEGDVFLDGMLVGRWMSRFLSREVSRASAGPTGFDPRRGQLLPGVTVGG